jgi:putative PIN family toxin of toxin-antitoxin system
MVLENPKARIVLDTNIYISALLFSGIPEEILDLAREGKYELIISPSILLELGKILQAKFNFSKKEILFAFSEIKRISKLVIPCSKIDIIKDDPMDNHIIECAVDSGAQYIVTGDKKHLRSLASYRNIKILLPSEFIKL